MAAGRSVRRWWLLLLLGGRVEPPSKPKQTGVSVSQGKGKVCHNKHIYEERARGRKGWSSLRGCLRSFYASDEKKRKGCAQWPHIRLYVCASRAALLGDAPVPRPLPLPLPVLRPLPPPPPLDLAVPRAARTAVGLKATRPPVAAGSMAARARGDGLGELKPPLPLEALCSEPGMPGESGFTCMAGDEEGGAVMELAEAGDTSALRPSTKLPDLAADPPVAGPRPRRVGAKPTGESPLPSPPALKLLRGVPSVTCVKEGADFSAVSSAGDAAAAAAAVALRGEALPRLSTRAGAGPPTDCRLGTAAGAAPQRASGLPASPRPGGDGTAPGALGMRITMRPAAAAAPPAAEAAARLPALLGLASIGFVLRIASGLCLPPASLTPRLGVPMPIIEAMKPMKPAPLALPPPLPLDARRRPSPSRSDSLWKEPSPPLSLRLARLTQSRSR